MKIILTSDLHYGFHDNTQAKIIRLFNKINQENPDLVLIAGDIATTKQRQFVRCLEIAREHLTCDIAIVRGNHDFWDRIDRKDKQSGNRPLREMYRLHEETCKRLDIHILSSEPLVYDDIQVYGFDGWYETADPGTNDHYNMPMQVDGCPIMPYLTNKAWKDFQDCLDVSKLHENKTKILVTHHNLYEEPKYPGSKHGGVLRFLPEVKENFDILCCGHTHEYQNYKDDNLLVLNCGSDYNIPNYLVFEVGEENGRHQEAKSKEPKESN